MEWLAIDVDFVTAKSVHAPANEDPAPMTQPADRLTGNTFLKPIVDRLTRAAGMARAAIGCAEAGDDEGAARILVEIDVPIYEAQSLLNAATLLNRLDREEGPSHKPERSNAKRKSRKARGR